MLKRSNSTKALKLNKFRDYKEYLSYNGDYNTKVSRLQIATTEFLSKLPESERLRFWLSLIPPETKNTLTKEYKELSSDQNLEKQISSLPQKETIYNDISAATSFMNGDSKSPASHIITETKREEIQKCICMIFMKYVQLQYHSGWALIACVASSVTKTEEELYLVFLHIIQNVFPKDFFMSDSHHDHKTIELYRFLVLLKIKMPELAAVLHLETSSKIESKECLFLDVNITIRLA